MTRVRSSPLPRLRLRPAHDRRTLREARAAEDPGQHAKRVRSGLLHAAWQRLRKAVLERDGHRCQRCGKPANSVHLRPSFAPTTASQPRPTAPRSAPHATAPSTRLELDTALVRRKGGPQNVRARAATPRQASARNVHHLLRNPGVDRRLVLELLEPVGPARAHALELRELEPLGKNGGILSRSSSSSSIRPATRAPSRSR